MSDIDAKKRRLQELKDRRAQQQGRISGHHPRAPRNIVGVDKEDDHNLHQKKEVVVHKPEETLKVQGYVGVFNIAPKQKAYRYEQAVNVSKEDIALVRMLQEEEEAVAALDFGSESTESDEELEGVQEIKKDPEVKRVSEQEVKKILESNRFKRFIRKGSQELESELEDTINLVGDLLENENPDIAPDMREKLSFKQTIKYEVLLSGHSCVGVKWCRSNASHFLAIYNAIKPEEFIGKIVVWNIENLREPKTVLYSMRKINRADFDISNENIIYAALHSGQIMCWDLREGTDPKDTSKPSLDAHVLPVFCMEQVSDGKRDILVTFSYEGKVCFWDKDNVCEVQRSEVLTFRKENGGANTEESNEEMIPIAPTVSIVTDQTKSAHYHIFVATHDNIILNYDINSLLLESETETAPTMILRPHSAPIISLAYKKNIENPQIDGMLASGSFDFSIAITLPKLHSIAFHHLQIHEDYVTALDWNPEHPAMLVSADCSGKLCLWNLIEDRDYPVFITKRSPISTLQWSFDGTKLIIGTLDGDIEVWILKKKWLGVVEEELEEFEEFVNRA